MMGNDVHAVLQIEAVGIESLDAGIQMQFGTALGGSVPNEPAEQLSAVASGLVSNVSDQIVHVHPLSVRQCSANPETGDRHDIPSVLQTREPVTVRMLLPDAADKLFLGQRRAQLHHDRKAAADFGIGGDQSDFHFRLGGEVLSVSKVQCRKWRMPVNTMAMSCWSAASITSASRTEPPG